VRAICKGKKIEKKEERRFVEETNTQMEKLRKDGRRKLRRKIEEVTEDEDLPLVQRIEQLRDQASFYTEFMEKLISKSKLDIDGLDFS
jgi:polyhydroxyalkanoate synthesis regulator phasin